MRPWIHETMDATRCTFERSYFQHPPKMPVLTIDSASAEFRKDSQFIVKISYRLIDSIQSGDSWITSVKVFSRNRNKKTSKWTSNCHHPLYGCFPSQTPPIFQAPPFECLPDSLEEKAASRSSGGKQGLQLWIQPSVGFLNVFEGVIPSIFWGKTQRTRGCPSHGHARTYLVWAKSNVSSIHCGQKAAL